MIIDLLLKKLRGELYYSIRDYMTLNILCNRRNNDFENGLKNGVEFLYLFFKSKQHLISMPNTSSSTATSTSQEQETFHKTLDTKSDSLCDDSSIRFH